MPVEPPDELRLRAMPACLWREYSRVATLQRPNMSWAMDSQIERAQLDVVSVPAAAWRPQILWQGSQQSLTAEVLMQPSKSSSKHTRTAADCTPGGGNRPACLLARFVSATPPSDTHRLRDALCKVGSALPRMVQVVQTICIIAQLRV